MSGYIGTVPDPTDVAAPGVWSISDVSSGEADSLWPTNESYVHLAQTAAGNGATSLTFTNIPQTFDDLLIRGTVGFAAGSFGASQPGDVLLQGNYANTGANVYSYMSFNQTSSITTSTGSSASRLPLTSLPLNPDSMLTFTIMINNYRGGTGRTKYMIESIIGNASTPGSAINRITAVQETAPLQTLQIYSDYLLYSSSAVSGATISNLVDLYGIRRVTV